MSVSFSTELRKNVLDDFFHVNIGFLIIKLLFETDDAIIIKNRLTQLMHTEILSNFKYNYQHKNLKMNKNREEMAREFSYMMSKMGIIDMSVYPKIKSQIVVESKYSSSGFIDISFNIVDTLMNMYWYGNEIIECLKHFYKKYDYSFVTEDRQRLRILIMEKSIISKIE